MLRSTPETDPDLIVAGRIRRADGSWGRGEIWIAGDVIASVHDSPPEGQGTGAKRIDVGNDFVLPGAVDAHVHSLSHSGEGIRAASAAAAAGGVTTIVEMPFDATGPISNRDRLLAKQDLVSDEASVDVTLLGTLAPGTGWRQADELAENGVAGFKVSLFLTDDFRFPRINDYELLDVMHAVSMTGRTLCTHAENNEIVKALLASEGSTHPTDPQAHSRSRPPVSETLGVLTALEVAANQGASLHVCHLSLPRSIDLVNWYRSQGVDVTMETCPHYLTFTESDLEDQRGRLKINPPIRSSDARSGIWSRLEKGQIDVVSSDHAPWPLALKSHEHILDNHSGVPGVETLVAASLGGALQRDQDLTAFGAMVDSLTINPAKRFGLDRLKGTLEPGKDADIMIFSPDPDAVVDPASLHSNAGWSPYGGMALGGRVTTTILRGEVIWTHAGGFSGRLDRGRLISRAAN